MHLHFSECVSSSRTRGLLLVEEPWRQSYLLRYPTDNYTAVSDDVRRCAAAAAHNQSSASAITCDHPHSRIVFIPRAACIPWGFALLPTTMGKWRPWAWPARAVAVRAARRPRIRSSPGPCADESAGAPARRRATPRAPGTSTPAAAPPPHAPPRPAAAPPTDPPTAPSPPMPGTPRRSARRPAGLAAPWADAPRGAISSSAAGGRGPSREQGPAGGRGRTGSLIGGPGTRPAGRLGGRRVRGNRRAGASERRVGTAAGARETGGG